MNIISESIIPEDDLLKQLDELRIHKDCTLNLSFNNKKFEFAAHEWNRILDLSAKGYAQE